MRSVPEQHLPWPEPSENAHPAPAVWKCRLPTSSEIVALVRTEADASRLCPDMLVFTLAEVAVAIEALGEAALEATRAFPGATVSGVRPRSSPAEAKEGHPERNATRKPTCGREQSLSKKMPRDTLYRGDCASDPPGYAVAELLRALLTAWREDEEDELWADSEGDDAA